VVLVLTTLPVTMSADRELLPKAAVIRANKAASTIVSSLHKEDTAASAVVEGTVSPVGAFPPEWGLPEKKKKKKPRVGRTAHVEDAAIREKMLQFVLHGSCGSWD
jgi:hypothetical protein